LSVKLSISNRLPISLSKRVFMMMIVETAKSNFKNEMISKGIGVIKVEYAKYIKTLKDKARLINRRLSN
jgi:hypothetical protein